MSKEGASGGSFIDALRKLPESGTQPVASQPSDHLVLVQPPLPPDEVVTITETSTVTRTLQQDGGGTSPFLSSLKEVPTTTQSGEGGSQGARPLPSDEQGPESTEEPSSADGDYNDPAAAPQATTPLPPSNAEGAGNQPSVAGSPAAEKPSRAVGDRESASALAMGVGAGSSSATGVTSASGGSANAVKANSLKSSGTGERPSKDSTAMRPTPAVNKGTGKLGAKVGTAKESAKGKAKDAAKKATKKVAVSAANAVASNPVTAGIALAVILGIGLMVLLLASFAGSGGLGLGAMAPSATVIKEIPAAYLIAYEKAAADNGVPWPVIAAMGKLATDHGRFGPIDATTYGGIVDREPLRQNDVDPRIAAALKTSSSVRYHGSLSINQCNPKISGVKDGTCPVLPAIGVGNAPKGPMLLTAAAVVALGGRNPQDINIAAEFVAAKLAVAERAVISNDPTLANWTSNAASADKLWASAVDQITGKWVANPNSVATKCVNSIPQGSDVPNLIKFLVSCQAEQLGGLQVVSSEKLVAHVATYATLTGSVAVAQITSDALAAANSSSNFGKVACNNSLPTPQGLFPLSKAEAGGIDRCNVAANANRAVALVLAGEVSDPSTRSISAGRYAPLLGGWLKIPAVFGSDLPKLLANGPYQPNTPSAFCTGAVDSWLLKIAGKLQAGSGITQAAAAVTLPSHTQGCNIELKDPLTLYRTAAIRTGALTTDLGEGSNAANLLVFSAKSTTSGAAASLLSQSPLNVALLQLQSYFQTEALLLELNLSPSSSAAIPRLSLNGLGSSYPVPNPTLSLPNTTSYGGPVVAQAILFGGTFPTDTRGAKLEAAVNTRRGARGSIPLPTAAPTTTVGSGDTLALSQIDPSITLPDPWSASWVGENFTSCGSGGNANFTARVQVVTAWENMCEDALADGVNLTIASAARSNQEQTALVSRLGSSLAVAAARNVGGSNFTGGSTNEKGLVVDLSTTDVAGANWVHAVVGCYKPSPTTTTEGLYQNLPVAVDFQIYARGGGEVRCPIGLTPITRAQTYGFVSLCKSYSSAENWGDPTVLACLGAESGSGAIRAWWNLQLGGLTSVTLNSSLIPARKPKGKSPAPTSSTTTTPGGTTTTTKNGGTTTTTTPNGTITTTTPNGTTTVVTPGGFTTTTTPDGTTTTRAPDGTTITRTSDGTTTTRVADGTITTITPSGTTIIRATNGTIITTTPGGPTITKSPNGAVTTTKPGSTPPTPIDAGIPTSVLTGSADLTTAQNAEVAKAVAEAWAVAVAIMNSTGAGGSPMPGSSTSAVGVTNVQSAVVARAVVSAIQANASNIAELAQGALLNLNSVTADYNSTESSYAIENATVTALGSYIASLQAALPKGSPPSAQIISENKKLAVAKTAFKKTVAKLKSKATLLAAAKALYASREVAAQAELVQVSRVIKGLSKGELAKLLVLQASENVYYQKISLAAAKSKLGATGAEAVALKFAFAQVGKVYVFGGSGLTYWDCSGLVMRALQKVGISTPHFAAAQANFGKAVALNQIQPGDLLFFGAPISHVGIYIGGGRMLDAPHSGALVRVDTFGSSFGSDKLVAARRF